MRVVGRRDAGSQQVAAAGVPRAGRRRPGLPQKVLGVVELERRAPAPAVIRDDARGTEARPVRNRGHRAERLDFEIGVVESAGPRGARRVGAHVVEIDPAVGRRIAAAHVQARHLRRHRARRSHARPRRVPRPVRRPTRNEARRLAIVADLHAAAVVEPQQDRDIPARRSERLRAGHGLQPAVRLVHLSRGHREILFQHLRRGAVREHAHHVRSVVRVVGAHEIAGLAAVPVANAGPAGRRIALLETGVLQDIDLPLRVRRKQHGRHYPQPHRDPQGKDGRKRSVIHGNPLLSWLHLTEDGPGRLHIIVDTRCILVVGRPGKHNLS